MDIFKMITDRVIAQMESGEIPWEKPWISAGQCNSHTTGKPYSLLNQMMLNCPGEYLTYKQCSEEGGHVRKGEKSSMVVFWKWLKVMDDDTQEEKEVPMLRYYNVFHIDQCEGIAAKYQQEMPDNAQPDATAETIITDYISRSGVKVVHEQGDRAYYRPSTDTITLPMMQQFKSTAEYYGTAFHEITHSTGHHTRLDRLDKTAFFGTEQYSKEELIAEIGSAALVNHCGIETDHSIRNNAAYIQNWLQVLRNDKRFIVSASAKAEKAVNMILGRAV